MKSIRCRHATDWVELKTELEVQGQGHAVPQNPLQHEDPKTTEYYYAQKGSNSKEKAKARITIKKQEQSKLSQGIE